MSALTKQDIDNAMSGWNTVGSLSGCATDWTPEDSPSHGHVLDCQCPPYHCNDCGQTQPQREICGCWTSLEGLPFADLKAIFADMDLSLEKEQGDD